MKNSLRVAVIQTGSAVFDTEKTLTKVATFAQKAAEGGAELVVFPEAFVAAYPKGLNFGSVIGGRTPEGRDDYRRYFESAIAVPGPGTEFIGNIARTNNIYIVIGVIERDGGTLYCTALFFSSDGTLMGKHRKLMPTAGERLIWGYGDGSTMPVFDTPFGKLGAVICWENYMPLMRMAMYAKGVQIYCAPTADNRPTWAPSMQHVALEGRCFVLSACQFLKRKDCPDNYDAIQGDDPEAILMSGGSCIVSPLGEFLAGPVFDQEAVLFADLDLRDIPRAKYDFDVAGHYSRPDIFRLIVNEASTPAVTFTGKTAEKSADEF